MKNIWQKYCTWRDARAITEAMVHVTADNQENLAPLSAYDQMFPYHPDYIKRFLPAAFRQIRSQPEMNFMEFKDKDAFRRAVVQAAFQMHRLSSTDTDQWGQEVAQGQMQAQGQPAAQESVNEDYASGQLTHIRAFQFEKKNEYLAILNEKTFMNVSADGLFRIMASKMDPMIALKLIKKLKETGELVYDAEIYDRDQLK